jgi:Receptor family ligand binding region
MITLHGNIINGLTMTGRIERKVFFGLLTIFLCQLNGMLFLSEKFHDCNNNHHKTIVQGRHKHAHYDEIPFLTYDDNDTMGIDIKLMQHIYGRHKRKYYELNHEHEFPHWPVKKEAVTEGDLILGGLMMVHEREDNLTCGPIMPQGGVQALEAMLFTLDRINNMSLLKNITIGAHILDDCDKDSYGLEMAVDFIKGEENALLSML